MLMCMHVQHADFKLDGYLQVTCMHVDEKGAMLWTGHADGYVRGFWLGGVPGTAINIRAKWCWQVCDHPCEAYIIVSNYLSPLSSMDSLLVMLAGMCHCSAGQAPGSA